MNSGTILILRPGALGDAVLTLPALHALRLAGAAKLLVLGTFPHWSFVRQSHDGLRVRDFSSSEWLGLFSADATLGEAARAALAQVHTAVLFLNDSAEIAANLRQAGIKQIVAAAPPVADTDTNGRHASDVLLDALAGLCAPDAISAARQPLLAAQNPFLRLDDAERQRALERIGLEAVPPGGLLGLHPGSGGRKKCWPARLFARLAIEASRRHGMLPLVFFGSADDEVRAAFEAALPPGVDWQPAAGRPLREVFALLNLCRAYVGNDSGITHLAAKTCPTMALFGPTNPAVWGPRGERVCVLAVPDGDLLKIRVEDVLHALLPWIESGSRQ